VRTSRNSSGRSGKARDGSCGCFIKFGNSESKERKMEYFLTKCNVWKVLRAPTPSQNRILGTITDPEGLVADDDQDKRRMLAAIYFLKLNRYEGDTGTRKQKSEAYRSINCELVCKAQGSNNKAQGGIKFMFQF
jgi:hypothetical protein